MNILNFIGLQLVLNNLNLVIRHSKARKRKDISQILYQLRVKFIFLCFGIKASLAEILKYFLNMLVMFGYVIWVDKYIVQIDYDTDIQKVGEEVIHELLKDYRSISKTKRHYKLLELYVMYSKSGFPFITIGYVN